ncbi:hypothetical protein AYL99_11984 [Fonsecaea erecta]|uniref:F-box domain-containing protein n=1 Tax=Fonsecaea erecta TaxID=1367422 RepID=A0A178Z297_9EURO|nr:hypothetical protein AYL99_11984 [Fonsecaea erecta]OAP53827.1 hypothetical protein AYL99_11984 [Fonsecaea erecta]
MRGTASGEDLSDEVLVRIAGFLGVQSQQGLCYLCRCSKSLYYLTTPELYRNVRLPGITNIQRFLRSLCKHPYRASGTESLSILDHNYPSIFHDPWIGTGYIESCRALLFSNNSAQFSAFLDMETADITAVLSNRDHDRGLWLAFLVLQLPSLRKIKLELNGGVFFLGKLFDFALTRKPDLNLFPFLSTIEIGTGRNYAAVNVFPFLRVQTLRNFSARHVLDGGPTDLSLVPQIRSLELLDSFEKVADLLALLKTCHHLRTVQISRNESDANAGNEYQIMRALSDSHGASLEQLDFYSWTASKKQQVVNMGRFVNLTSLKLPSPMILPHQMDASGLPIHLLLPLLNVRDLTLYLTYEFGPLENFWLAVQYLITREDLTPMLTSLCLAWAPGMVDLEQDKPGRRGVAEAARDRGVALRLIEGFYPRFEEVPIPEDSDVEDSDAESSQSANDGVPILEKSDAEDPDAEGSQSASEEVPILEDSDAESSQSANGGVRILKECPYFRTQTREEPDAEGDQSVNEEEDGT